MATIILTEDQKLSVWREMAARGGKALRGPEKLKAANEALRRKRQQQTTAKSKA